MELKKIITNLFCIIFILIILFILISSIMCNNAVNRINLFQYNSISIIAGAVLFIALLLFLYSKIKKINKINYKILVPIIFIIIITIQIIVGFSTKVDSKWDMDVILKAASNFTSGEGMADVDYLYKYPNNIGITYFFRFFFKIADFFGIQNFYNVAIIINILMIDLAILFTFLVAKKIFKGGIPLFVLILLSVFTPIYTYVAITYTDTITMVFPVLILYLYILSCEENSKLKKTLLYISISIVTFIGMTIKFTVVIMLIAIFIYNIIYKNKLKNLSIFLVSILIPLFLLCQIKSMIINSLFNEEKTNSEKYPITHWIMMGLNDLGVYNSYDDEYTSNFKTIEDKKNANLLKINKRLKQIISDSPINFFANKLTFIFGDGTYFAPNKLSRTPINRNFMHELILVNGKYVVFYKYFSQIQHISIFILILISGFYFIKNKFESEQNEGMIFNICIIGVIIFFSLWEARSRYIVNFIPVFILTSIYGLEFINNKINSIKIKKIGAINLKEDENDGKRN